jgi:predicted  nucleic acid-binding Zn-ribbon protein
MSTRFAYPRETAPEGVVPFVRSREEGELPTGRSSFGPGSAYGSSRSQGEASRRDWSAASLALEKAAQHHHARMEELREFEARILDKMRQLEAALRHEEARARAAEKRAQEAERRAAEAEEWMQRMCEKIHEHFGRD